MSLPSAPPRYEFNEKWSIELDRRLTSAAGDLPSDEPERLYTFHPRLDVGLQGQQVDDFIHSLYPDLIRRQKATHPPAVRCALFAIACCRSYENVGFLQKTTTTSTAAPKRYAQAPFKPPLFAKILKELADRGYLVRHKGFKTDRFPEGLTTLWLPTDSGRRLVRDVTPGACVSFLSEGRELVVLKSEDKVEVDYEDTDTTRDIRAQLARTNAARVKCSWRYRAIDLDDSDEHRKASNYDDEALAALNANISVYENDWTNLGAVDLECRRIFNGSFTAGGRYYCPAQNLRKIERETLEIDGKSTIELDFKSHQARILYHLKSLDSPEDCYDLPGRPRAVWKHIGQLAMSCKSRGEALNNLRRKYEIETDEAEEMLAAYQDRHRDVADIMFRAKWAELQYADSELTRSILDGALEQGIPVLPVHDSYITSTEHGSALGELMRRCYHDAFGYEARIGGFDHEYTRQLVSELEGQNKNR
ncbi:hypothetical protein [Microbulbifer sp. CAU 1566]|uniref:hypothetical protein n=1 Tax=Microbulbifer sp. CAU 1566 TaxID=2933269 RepID=UPI002002A2F0|nr:hypothetical protein [Microbulbifer sp. CAU 1566]